jgi:hypothetical protein
MENAAIYKFKNEDRCIIHCLSKVKMGASIATEPFIVLKGSTSLEEIMTHLLVAMSKSQTNLPNPKDWKTFSSEFLKSMGFQNYKDLHKNSLLVNVNKDEGMLIFSPTINLGAKDGFRNLSDKIIKVHADEKIAELANSLQNALNNCE